MLSVVSKTQKNMNYIVDMLSVLMECYHLNKHIQSVSITPSRLIQFHSSYFRAQPTSLSSIVLATLRSLVEASFSPDHLIFLFNIIIT